MYIKPFRTLLTTYLRIPHYLPPSLHQISCHNSRLMATVTNPDWARVERPGATPHLVYTKPLLKSEQDDRDYRIIRLENGLQATLVHDGKADKAAGSLDVAVGHLYDPDDMPGLAHFCEHLLFLGTKQFPKENSYKEFLVKNNGQSNAYTSTSNTNFYFSVATSGLTGTLERFSSFFHSPLFTPSCTLRELNAVNSENLKNHQSDVFRIFQLNKHLSQPGHVWSKFGSGNKESLSKAAKELKAQGKLRGVIQNDSLEHLKSDPSPVVSRAVSRVASRVPSPAPSFASNSSDSDADGGSVGRETRRRLVEWWTEEYCASRMRLCVIGKESLDDLTEIVTTLFSPILNRGKEALPMIKEHPFGVDEKGTLVSVETVMAFHVLEISFPLEYQPPFWKHKPIKFITHFVGHEGPGSLHSYLKKKQWVTSLNCGNQNLARGFAMFKITIHMTPEGFINYRSVILAVHKYLALLRSTKFSRFHHEELVNLSAIQFRFAEKTRPQNYATWVSEHMAWPLPMEFLLAGPKLIWDWDSDAEREVGEAKIAEYLQQFRVHECRVFLMAKKDEHLKLNPNIAWHKEPWYGTEYSVQRFDETFNREAEGINDIPELFLPGRNVFIATNLEVDKKIDIQPLQRPHLIRETPLSVLWHKKDDRFWVPKARITIDLRSHCDASARAAVLNRLYSDIVNDSLTEFAYDADLAGLKYSLGPLSNGLLLTFSGYNDKISVLVGHILEKVKGLVVDPQRLSVMKEQLRLEWGNFFFEKSCTISDFYAQYLLSERQWTTEEKLAELPSVTFEDVQKHVKELLAQVNMRIFVIGNMSKDEAIRIAEMAEENLGPSPFSPVDLNDRALILPPGSNLVWSAPLPNVNQANSALTYYLHIGSVVDQKLRIVSLLLSQILSEPAFSILRTREQLGYIVSCTSWLLPGASERGLRIVVQSEKKPGYLEERVEAFLEEMKTKLEDMADEEFESHKSGLGKRWLEADKNLYEEASRLLTEIANGHLDFLKYEKDAFLLKTITKDDVLSLFMTRVHPSSKTRAKLSIHMVSQKIRTKKVSLAASQAFETLVHEAFPDVDEKAWKESVESDALSLVEFGHYWLKILDSDEGRKFLAQLPVLVDKYPVDGEGEDRRRSEITYIEDPKAFKAGLTVSVDPGPFVQWDDLPVSRL